MDDKTYGKNDTTNYQSGNHGSASGIAQPRGLDAKT
jgi:hypothetical protein